MSGQDGEGPGVGAGSCVIAEPASPGPASMASSSSNPFGSAASRAGVPAAFASSQGPGVQEATFNIGAQEENSFQGPQQEPFMDRHADSDFA